MPLLRSISALALAAWISTIGTSTIAFSQTPVAATSYLIRVTVTDPQNRPKSGAEIRIDDTAVGLSDDDGQYYMSRKPLPDGPHTVSARLQGYTAASQEVKNLAQIANDPRARGLDVRLKLGPAPPPVTRPVTRGAAPEPNHDVVRIFYATDRQDTHSADPLLRYSGERAPGGELARGYCDVSIPSIHVKGELESPSWLQLEFTPDPEKHVVLKTVQPLATDAFYDMVAARVAASPSKEAVVYIHGFNNSFENAARQTAQIALDAGFDGAPILYSWPSKNRLLSYTQDEDTIQWTMFHLRDFLQELGERSHAKKIHLIAHSMGNRALVPALQLLASRSSQAAAPFDQVVLAAPDIGADVLGQYAREIVRTTRRLTLYASSNDDALLMSRFIHGASRAGQGDSKNGYLLVAQGIDTVDASAMRTDFIGHTYFAKSGSIIDDIRKIFTNDAPPELRNLVPKTLGELRYWLMPSASAPAR